MRSKRITALLLAGAACMGLALSGCGSQVNEKAVFATLDDVTITMGVANFCAKYQQVMYDSYMSYFGENMWNSDMYGNGTTMTDDVKNNVAEQLQTMYLLKAHMKEYNISISEEDEAAIAKAAEDFIAANSKAAIKQIGASDIENVKEMLRINTIHTRMHDRIIQDADTNVTDEEAAQRTFRYVSINTDGYTNDESKYVEYTEEEKAELKTKAEAIADAKEFDAAVEDAGYTVSTTSYGSAEDENASMDKAVLEAADKLKEGEISKVIETDTAYYVICLESEYDKDATEKKKEELISEKQENYYNDILDGWKEKAEWKINESEWAKVTFEDRFTQPQPEGTESLEESTDSAAAESIADTQE